MKSRFNTYDIICAVAELQTLVGLRVNQIYDIDNKTYLVRLQGGSNKVVLLMESGNRFHTTQFEWPKNMTPSGFSMKLRKHLKNKRLEKLQQLGTDRIVDFQFGVGEAACHIILELYDRGNIVLTDHEFTILYVLRPHSELEEVRFAVREKYPIERVKQQSMPTEETLSSLIEQAGPSDSLRRLLMTSVDCGPAVLDHVLLKHKLNNCIVNPNKEVPEGSTKTTQKTKKRNKENNATARHFDMEEDFKKLLDAIQDIDNMLSDARTVKTKGYIIQKKEEKPSTDGLVQDYFYQNIEFHPYLFIQFEGQPVKEFESFMLAIDEFYSTLEGQKIDLKTLQQERDALKKLSNVKIDHAKRLEELNKSQEYDKQKAELITSNQVAVDNAILAIRSAIANQMSWPDISELVKAAQARGDPVAGIIKQLKLEVNHIALELSDPYSNTNSDSDSSENVKGPLPSMIVEVDLALSAWANARKYYNKKRTAAQKEQKTIDASQKALKSAEKKTQQTLKDVRTVSTISKARKVYWFEKFYWFISSENYLVIGGRDAQQNELIVKRYMRPSDIYVHAEIQGASSVLIRNTSANEIPPKTLLEAGTMAISYSVAWDAKVVTNAYWVYSHQVSKTAPTGEYLGTGSFMIRGKKNFLPSCNLIMGLSLLFKLEDSFVERHRGERKVRTLDDEGSELPLEEDFKDLVLEPESANATDVGSLDPGHRGERKLSSLDEEEVEVKVEGNDNDADADPNSVIDQDEEEEEENGELQSNFPDTEIKITHDLGSVSLPKDSANTTVDLLKTIGFGAAEETTIIPAAPTRKKQQQNVKKRKEQKEQKERKLLSDLQHQNQNTIDNKNSAQIKRGQKGKLKKIKAKYKDQDEEERMLRMQILKSSGKEKIIAEEKHVQEAARLTNKNKLNQQQIQNKQQVELEMDENDDVQLDADISIIDTLTAQPFEDDEILFAIPIVAPYQSLQNYKFKVKLTPGTGKRGRAAKTALVMFSNDKSCGPREKDLLKGIKEEALARNIPGKVRLSAPQLQKYKNK